MLGHCFARAGWFSASVGPRGWSRIGRLVPYDLTTPEEARMPRVAWLSLGVLFALAVSGCGDSQPAGDTAGTAGGAEAASLPSGESAPSQQAAQSGPGAAASHFLEAARHGEDQKAEQMLTPLARQKLREGGNRQGLGTMRSDTAEFTIDEVKLVGEDGAQAKATIYEVAEGGERIGYEVAILLRKVAEGWRVAGVATPVFNGEWMLVRNFEDPDDWQRQLQRYDEEVRRRAAQNALQAKQPAAGTTQQ